MGSPRRFRSRRAGSALVVAMLYMMLFSVLAVGFSAGSAMSIQTAARDKSAADAQNAAESGIEWARCRLGKIIIDPTMDEPKLSEAIQQALADAGSDFLLIDPENGLRFRTSISVGERTGERTIDLKVVGRGNDASIERAIALQFRIDPERGNWVAVPETYTEVAP